MQGPFPKTDYGLGGGAGESGGQTGEVMYVCRVFRSGQLGLVLLLSILFQFPFPVIMYHRHSEPI